MDDRQVRHICFTLNNYTHIEFDAVIAIKCKYMVVGKEVGENGTPHLQGYIEFDGGKRFSTLKKMLPRAHIEQRKGTAEQAANYCKKDNDFFEKGERSTQGARADLDELKNKILDGSITARQIRQDTPHIFHQYGRTIDKLESDRQETVMRTHQTHGVWLWGSTGTGKSETAFKDFHPDTHYVWKLNDGNWQDGYKQQDIVIIDDFRGSICYDEILRMTDKYPNFNAPRRGLAPLPFTSKLVIITSSLPPDEVYCRRNARDSIEQLNRRFKIFNTPFQIESATEVLRVILT